MLQYHVDIIFATSWYKILSLFINVVDLLIFFLIQEREKKAKKKAATNGHVSDPYADLEEPVEAIEEAMEPEKLDISTAACIPSKAKMDKRASSVRYRNKLKGMESRPKAMIKRKKLSNDLLWIALIVFLGLFLLMIAYLYITTPEMHRHKRYVV